MNAFFWDSGCKSILSLKVGGFSIINDGKWPTVMGTTITLRPGIPNRLLDYKCISLEPSSWLPHMRLMMRWHPMNEWSTAVPRFYVKTSNVSASAMIDRNSFEHQKTLLSSSSKLRPRNILWFWSMIQSTSIAWWLLRHSCNCGYASSLISPNDEKIYRVKGSGEKDWVKVWRCWRDDLTEF